jgi:dsRNA-specific ribonuclease
VARDPCQAFSRCVPFQSALRDVARKFSVPNRMAAVLGEAVTREEKLAAWAAFASAAMQAFAYVEAEINRVHNYSSMHVDTQLAAITADQLLAQMETRFPQLFQTSIIEEPPKTESKLDIKAYTGRK